MSNRAASSQSNSRSGRHASFQGTLHAPATPLPRIQGNRRHSHYPVPSPLSLGNRNASISCDSARHNQTNTATSNDSHYTASKDAHTLARASFVTPGVRKANLYSPSLPSKLQDVQGLELFECTSPLEFGSQEAASLQGVPDTSFPICSTPNLSKSPASPNTPPSPSTPSQHSSLADLDLDLRSCADLLAFHRVSLASRQRTSAMTSLDRSNSYRPSQANRPFQFPMPPVNTAPSTPAGRSSYTTGIPNSLPLEGPKSAPPSSEARRLRRQGIDFHSHTQFAQEFKLSGIDFQPDCIEFENKSSVINTNTQAQVQCDSISECGGRTEDTLDILTEPEFDAEADFSWEAEDMEDSPDPLDLDGFSELGLFVPGSDGNFHSDENSFLDFLYSREGTVDDDVFSHLRLVKDIQNLVHAPSSASSTLTHPSQRSTSRRPILSPLTLPTIIEPCRPTSPMNPYYQPHWRGESSVSSPRDLHDPGTAEISSSENHVDVDGEPPRSAFDSDSDLESSIDHAGSPRNSKRGQNKQPGKLRRLKDALKGSVSMPSMRAAKAKHASEAEKGTRTPGTSSSRFADLPPLPIPNSPKVSASSHAHTASFASTISAISITSRSSSTPGTSTSTSPTTPRSSNGSSQGHLSPVNLFMQRATSRRSRRRGSQTSSVTSLSPCTPNTSSLEVDQVDQRRLNSSLTPSSYRDHHRRPSTSASNYSTYSSHSLSRYCHIDITNADDVGRSEHLKRRSPLVPSKSLVNLSTPVTTPPNLPLPPLPPIGTALPHLQSLEHVSPSMPMNMTPAQKSVKELPSDTSDTSGPVMVTVTDTANSTTAAVDVGIEDRKVLLEQSLAKLAKLRMPKSQDRSYTWGAARPSQPPKLEWLTENSVTDTTEQEPEVIPKPPAKKPSVVVSPTTLQRLDFSSLSVPPASPASCYSDNQSPSQDASSAPLLLHVPETAPRPRSRTEGIIETNRAPLLPQFDFERPKYPASLKDGSCGQHKRPLLAHHMRKSSSLSDLPRLLHLHSTNHTNTNDLALAMRSANATTNTFTLTHPTRSTNMSTSSSESSALPTPSDSSSPVISRASSTTSSARSYASADKPTEATSTHPLGDAKAVRPFLYRTVQKGFLSSSTLRPPRSSSDVHLPESEEQQVIQTSIQRNGSEEEGTEKKSKVKKFLGRVGSSKRIRGSLTVRN